MSMTHGLQFAEPPRLRLSRWTATAMFVVAVHAGAALALMRWQDEETSDSSRIDRDRACSSHRCISDSNPRTWRLGR